MVLDSLVNDLSYWVWFWNLSLGKWDLTHPTSTPSLGNLSPGWFGLLLVLETKTKLGNHWCHPCPQSLLSMTYEIQLLGTWKKNAPFLPTSTAQPADRSYTSQVVVLHLTCHRRTGLFHSRVVRMLVFEHRFAQQFAPPMFLWESIVLVWPSTSQTERTPNPTSWCLDSSCWVSWQMFFTPVMGTWKPRPVLFMMQSRTCGFAGCFARTSSFKLGMAWRMISVSWWFLVAPTASKPSSFRRWMVMSLVWLPVAILWVASIFLWATWIAFRSGQGTRTKVCDSHSNWLVFLGFTCVICRVLDYNNDWVFERISLFFDFSDWVIH